MPGLQSSDDIKEVLRRRDQFLAISHAYGRAADAQRRAERRWMGGETEKRAWNYEQGFYRNGETGFDLTKSAAAGPKAPVRARRRD